MTRTLDNIGTAMAPTWRARKRAPFTVYAVRMELVAQAAALPEWECDTYIDERLTDLDKALDCDQAEALERWLDCEALLQGRPASIGDGGGGGGRSSVLSDDVMGALVNHAEIKRLLSVHSRRVLAVLGGMMDAELWNLVPHLIFDVRHATAELTKIAHMRTPKTAQLLTKYAKSRL